MRISVVGNGHMGAFSFITQGLINAFNLAGHTAKRWDGITPWETPDLYLGCSGHKQKIPSKRERGNTKVGIHVNPYSDQPIGSVDNGPILDEPKGDIEWTLQQEPDFVYCYCSNTFTKQYYGNWTKKHGIPIVGMPPAADTTIFKPVAPKPEYACDIGWVGGYWGYKAKMLDIYMKPLMARYKCKIYGWGGWEHNKTIEESGMPALFSTATICPSISEPHSRVYPIDIPERVFKVPAGGGFTIHTPSPAIEDLFEDVVPIAKDPEHWLELIQYYLNNKAERERLANRQRRMILARHTYFDRCSDMLNAVGYTKEAEDITLGKWA